MGMFGNFKKAASANVFRRQRKKHRKPHPGKVGRPTYGRKHKNPKLSKDQASFLSKNPFVAQKRKPSTTTFRQPFGRKKPKHKRPHKKTHHKNKHATQEAINKSQTKPERGSRGRDRVAASQTSFLDNTTLMLIGGGTFLFVLIMFFMT